MQPDTGEILIRTTKAGTHVYTWVPPWLQERIKSRGKEVGPGSHQTKSLDVITELWRRKLNKLWEMSGPWKVKPTPHRFRHTFARIVFQRGVSVRDVADLLGNSEPMIRKHYAAWIPERQQRLTQILKDASGKTQAETRNDAEAEALVAGSQRDHGGPNRQFGASVISTQLGTGRAIRSDAAVCSPRVRRGFFGGFVKTDPMPATKSTLLAILPEGADHRESAGSDAPSDPYRFQ